MTQKKKSVSGHGSKGRTPATSKHSRRSSASNICQDSPHALETARRALAAVADEQTSILANSIVGICRIRSRRFIWANDRVVDIFGYELDELLDRSTQLLYLSKRAFLEFGKIAYPMMKKGEIFDGEHKFRRKDGAVIWCRLTGRVVGEDPTDTIWVIEDVTENKLAEQALRESEQRFRSLMDTINDWVWEVDKDRVYTFCSPACQRLLGFEPEEMVGEMTPFDLMAPTEARRVNKIFCRHMKRKTPISDLVSINRHKAGHEVMMETNAVPVLDNRRRLVGFRGVDRDVSHRARAAAQARRHEQEMREGLITAVHALSRTIEARDPYTAGHQNRVAELSVAIGGAMGMTEDELRGLKLGATVHDIGKIAIPNEILTRPGRFSIEEFNLVKTHTETGYDIIKDVELPWPVADMVRQHHERIDGSGYPKGLKAGRLRKESRIIAVADVVEAISSHRPYRPALGIEAGLAEIEEHKGTRYDAAVANTCLALFRENSFAFT